MQSYMLMNRAVFIYPNISRIQSTLMYAVYQGLRQCQLMNVWKSAKRDQTTNGTGTHGTICKIGLLSLTKKPANHGAYIRMVTYGLFLLSNCRFLPISYGGQIKTINQLKRENTMTYSQIKSILANPGEKCFYDSRFVIANEYGPIAIVYADHEQDALDIAVNAGKLDCQAMSDSDYAEYLQNGWDDSFLCAGNASEPFWCEYLDISKI